MIRNFNIDLGNTWQSLLLFGAGMALLAATYFGDPETVWRFAREDGLVENLTAVAYFFGMVACGIAIYRGRHVRIAAVWLFLSFLFLGEEVSWFQRVFGFSVPAVEAINAQGEFNIHNIARGGGRFLDENGQFSFEIGKLLNSQNLYRAGFFFYFFVIPVMVMFSARLRGFMEWWRYLRPSTGFIVAVWSVIFVSFVLAVNSPELGRNSMAEVREFYYAAVICLYAFMLAAPLRLSGLVGRSRPSDPGLSNPRRVPAPRHGARVT